MKQLLKTAVVAGFTLTLSGQVLFGQLTNPVVTIDEFGVGTLNGTVLPSSLGPDPSGGITTSPVLIYTLPFQVIPGDVVLVSSNEPANSPNYPISDVVRFWNTTSGNQSQIIFYSDFSPTDPANAPADVGIPSQLLQPIVGVNEIGPESGPNGATYIPSGPGLPGFAPALGLAQYNIISDVPEPGLATLLLSGLGVFFGVHHFRRSRPRNS